MKNVEDDAVYLTRKLFISYKQEMYKSLFQEWVKNAEKQKD